MEDEDDDMIVAEEAETNDDGMSSLPSYGSENPMLQMTQLMKVIGENIREKMRVSEDIL